MQGTGFREQGASTGLRAQGSGSRARGTGLRVQGAGSRARALESSMPVSRGPQCQPRTWGLGALLRVLGLLPACLSSLRLNALLKDLLGHSQRGGCKEGVSIPLEPQRASLPEWLSLCSTESLHVFWSSAGKVALSSRLRVWALRASWKTTGGPHLHMAYRVPKVLEWPGAAFGGCREPYLNAGTHSVYRHV